MYIRVHVLIEQQRPCAGNPRCCTTDSDAGLIGDAAWLAGWLAGAERPLAAVSTRWQVDDDGDDDSSLTPDAQMRSRRCPRSGWRVLQARAPQRCAVQRTAAGQPACLQRLRCVPVPERSVGDTRAALVCIQKYGAR
jgi:hypothetical protein